MARTPAESGLPIPAAGEKSHHPHRRGNIPEPASPQCQTAGCTAFRPEAMNRRRNEARPPVSIFFALFLAAGIAATGGVLHAYYKNRQVSITREIDAIDRRVEQYRLDIRTTEMRMDQLLNRFVIRKQIED